jgi:AraC-like DNA-binding protein
MNKSEDRLRNNNWLFYSCYHETSRVVGHLIKEKGEKPSDVYLEVGFEDLSHFSCAFKKEFGTAPSLLN